MSNAKKYTMGQASHTANLGTEHIFNFLQNQKSTVKVVNVESDIEYQKKDIDLIWVREINGEIRETTIEIKVDNYYRTGNYFFETLSNVERGTDGCFMYSEAKYLFYYFLNVELHVFNLAKAREWFVANRNRFKLVKTSTPINSFGDVYHTEGALVNRATFAKEYEGKLYTYPYTNDWSVKRS